MLSDFEKPSASRSSSIEDMSHENITLAPTRPKTISKFSINEETPKRDLLECSSNASSFQSPTDTNSLAVPSAASVIRGGESNGIMSFFTARQRKPTCTTQSTGTSAKQLRLMCIAKIDEVLQAVDDLIDFYSRVVKAENKVSNALWRTVQYSKSNKVAIDTNIDENIRTNIPSNTEASHSTLVEGNGSIYRVNSVASQARRLLQLNLDANESRAAIAACRATFHKRVTSFQLQQISEALQCLRSLSIELDTRLESYSIQLEVDIRECWKKYAKYADLLTKQRARLDTQLEKGISSKRKAIETLFNQLEETTLKLHGAHNNYTLSLATARHYNEWLVTRLRPCLYRNLSRCLRMVDFGVSHLLRLARVDQVPASAFELLSPESVGDLTLNCDLTCGEANQEETFRRAFPFDLDLIIRAGADGLQPDQMVVNPLTVGAVQKLLETHLQESVNQGSLTQLLEEEHRQLAGSLANWIDKLSPSQSNVSRVRDLPSLLKTDEAMNSYLAELDACAAGLGGGGEDLDKAYVNAALRPGAMCNLAVQMGTCEFFYCQSVCFADSHLQIVHILRDSKVVAPTPPLSLINEGGSSLPTSFSASGEKGLEILESRFHCLRVQTGEQEDSVMGDVPQKQSGNNTDSDKEETAMPPVGDNILTRLQRRSVKKIQDDLCKQFKLGSSNLPSPSSVSEKTSVLQSFGGSGNNSPHSASASITHLRNKSLKKETSDTCLLAKLVHRRKISEPSLSTLNQDSGGQNTNSPSQNGSREAFPKLPDDQEDVDINKEPWFHGVLPRTEVVRLLQNPGDFLVRETSKSASNSHLRRNRFQRHVEDPFSPTTGAWASTSNALIDDLHHNSDGSGSGRGYVTKMVLSVFWQGHKHFIIQGGEPLPGDGSPNEAFSRRRGGWSIEEYQFPTIRDLIEYHMKTEKPITIGSGALLLNPISRPDWQLENDDVVLLEKIGQGNFGEVHRGVYNGREVAVKTCRANPAEVEVRRKFLQGEATALNFFHPNIVHLIGIAVCTHPIMIVMEYVSGGSLLNFLRKQGSSADIRLLLQMCVDAANGMAYLEAKNCIHRDLAARNCLLTKDKVLKIADFGMAREEHVYELSDRNGPIPIKWTAPEALSNNRYTSKCDVWSFGILLWETFSAGDTPYHGLSNNETRDLVESGYRLPTPDRMPRQLSKHMHTCWHPNPNRRPTFAALVLSLTNLKQDFEKSEVLPSTADAPVTSTRTMAVPLPPGIASVSRSHNRKRISTTVFDNRTSVASTVSTTNSRLPRMKASVTGSRQHSPVS